MLRMFESMIFKGPVFCLCSRVFHSILKGIMNLVPTTFWIVCAAMLGGIFGSYANMASYRLPRGISTWKRQRSFCPKCEHQLAWFSDNIPILSFCLLRGRCRYCAVPIPPRYLVAE